MKRLAIILAAPSLTLANCATTPIVPVATIDRVQARYDAAKAWADLILPYVSPERAARIKLAMRVTEDGLAAARTAASIAQLRTALAQADAAAAAIRKSDDEIASPAASRRLGEAEPAAVQQR